MWRHLSYVLIGLGCVGFLIYELTPKVHLQFDTNSSAKVTTQDVQPPAITQTLADRAVKQAQAAIMRNPAESVGYTTLAESYMRKARESGDSSYYLQAETAIQKVLVDQPNSYEARRVLAWIALGKHDFSQSLLLAKQLQQERPNDYWVYGLLGDSYTELGDYSKAVEGFQQLMDRRPGLPAYSRASYMRWLHGDLEGAMELMRMAIRSGDRRDPEPLAWTLVQYGNLHFHQGQLEKAEAIFQQALTVFPKYYMALAGMGQIQAGQQQYTEAIQYYEQAIAVVPSPDLIGYLGDLYLIIGQEEQAERQYELVEFIEGVNVLNPIMYSRQLALFYANHQRNMEKALQLAEAEYGRRQDIYTQDALAWVYYQMGRIPEAWQTMEQALRLGTQDASLLYHAGMIAKGLGKTDKATHYLTEALSLNPYFSPLYLSNAKKALQDLTVSLNAHEKGHESNTKDS